MLARMDGAAGNRANGRRAVTAHQGFARPVRCDGRERYSAGAAGVSPMAAGLWLCSQKAETTEESSAKPASA